MSSGYSRTTINDVARKAGVSISTVSRVMNGGYFVTPELTEKVQKAIEALGYTPDSVARGMKSKYRYVIGYIVSDLANRHFTVISKVIENIIGSSGFSLIVCSVDADREKEKQAINLFLSNRVDGMIINTTGKNDDLIASISRDIPVVLLHRRLHHRDFRGDYIGSDNYEGGATLARHLLENGHSRIGLISSDNTISTFHERSSGFLDTLTAAGLTFDEGARETASYTEEGGYAAIGKLLKRRGDLTAVAIMNNATAIGALRYLREHRIPVPEKLSVLSFGEIINSSLLFVKPAFITQLPEEVGRLAADLIISRIRDNTLPPREEVVRTRFEKGDSVGNLLFPF